MIYRMLSSQLKRSKCNRSRKDRSPIGSMDALIKTGNKMLRTDQRSVGRLEYASQGKIDIFDYSGILIDIQISEV